MKPKSERKLLKSYSLYSKSDYFCSNETQNINL